MNRFDLSHGGKEYLNFTVDELIVAGVPQGAIDAHLEGERIDDIKDECRRRIYAEASQETQLNMLALSTSISSKTATARSADEKDHLTACDAGRAWVAAMQANVVTLAGDANLDIKDDANWPVCPAEVVALADQF